MRLLNDYELTTDTGAAVYCGDMSDGSTWLVLEGDAVVYTSLDVFEGLILHMPCVHKCKVAELKAAPQDLGQFVHMLNNYLTY